MSDWDVVVTASFDVSGEHEDLPDRLLDFLETELGDKAWSVTLDRNSSSVAAHFGISSSGGAGGAMERALTLLSEGASGLVVVGVQLERVQKLALA